LGRTTASVCWGSNRSIFFQARPCKSVAQAQASVSLHACVRVRCIGGLLTDGGHVCGSKTAVHRAASLWRSPCVERVVNIVFSKCSAGSARAILSCGDSSSKACTVSRDPRFSTRACRWPQSLACKVATCTASVCLASAYACSHISSQDKV
jgi:hypothetical protein